MCDQQIFLPSKSCRVLHFGMCVQQRSFKNAPKHVLRILPCSVGSIACSKVMSSFSRIFENCANQRFALLALVTRIWEPTEILKAHSFLYSVNIHEDPLHVKHQEMCWQFLSQGCPISLPAKWLKFQHRKKYFTASWRLLFGGLPWKQRAQHFPWITTPSPLNLLARESSQLIFLSGVDKGCCCQGVKGLWWLD